MSLAVLLLHGYLGSPKDLSPLAAALPLEPDDSLELLGLPGHGQPETPDFNEEAFLASLAARLDTHHAVGRQVVLIGHSTGGGLWLTELLRRPSQARSNIALVVLCATPPALDADYPRRWMLHRAQREEGSPPALHDIGALASMIRRLARRPQLQLGMPVLVVHGADDELVPSSAAAAWTPAWLGSPVRQVSIPGANHHLFAGPGFELALDAIVRAVADVRRRGTMTKDTAIPELQEMATSWPDSLVHLASSPAGRRAAGATEELRTEVDWEPTLANIEITTRCTLACPACARTMAKLKSRHMTETSFRQVLSALPHARRLMLVGLGEPLLHPQLAHFIRLAVADGRRVGLVTNAMELDAHMARELGESGLGSITFSLDAIDQTVADRVRPGSEMARIQANISNFMATKKSRGRTVSTSAFCALGRHNTTNLPEIIDFALGVGLDALMVSDLNFEQNRPNSLNQSLSPEQSRTLRTALRRALARGLPVLSVWGLEEYGLERRYADYLLLDPGQAMQRRPQRGHCTSPWQTIPVNVDGQVSICDCQPTALLGSLLHQPLSRLWNGPTMVEHRQRMLGAAPPGACLACPRF